MKDSLKGVLTLKMVNKHPKINGMPSHDDNNCYFIAASQSACQ